MLGGDNFVQKDWNVMFVRSDAGGERERLRTVRPGVCAWFCLFSMVAPTVVHL